MGANHAVDAVPIGHREGVQSQALGFLDELFRVARPFQESI
jgi:hypothetical protein